MAFSLVMADLYGILYMLNSPLVVFINSAKFSTISLLKYFSLTAYASQHCFATSRSAFAILNCFSPSSGIRSGSSAKFTLTSVSAFLIMSSEASGIDIIVVFPSVRFTRSSAVFSPPGNCSFR